jgi:ATP-binding cassette subfamily A (ABC1) protein 3
MGIFVIETYVYHNLDADSVDYNYADSIKNYPSLNAIIVVMLVSALVYMLLVLGMPFDGLRRRWNEVETFVTNFLFNTYIPLDGVQAAKDETYPCDSEDANPHGETTVLKVNDLSHIYPDGTHAVKDISFSIKEGEVLSFLGANGAGKSTCMGMLCGTLNASFGDANVNGYSITHQRTMARRNLGIAMQQDIIWDDVSVEDHLYLFGSLRGVFGAKLRDEVDAMVESLGFPEKRKSMAGTLSGGQKRRLCVGISMVGGNSVVYLDEPTAGLDPVSRRQLWELVQKNRAGE